MADGSLLKDETNLMWRQQRELEQAVLRQLASVHAREHTVDDSHQSAPEGERQNSIPVHPVIEKKGQMFDGIDPNVNPAPELNTDARREYDNERRNQEQEKQLRLGNMPSFTTAPKPHGPY
jgi:hypothetical protein